MNVTTFVKTNLKHDFSNREEITARAIKELHATKGQVAGAIWEIKRSGWNIRKFGKGAYRAKEVQKIVQIATGKTIGISEAQFKNKHDIFHIVTEAAKKLKAGRFLTESEFIQVNGIRGVGYRDALNHPDNQQYRGKAGSVYYWSHPETIEKYKNQGTLI